MIYIFKGFGFSEFHKIQNLKYLDLFYYIRLHSFGDIPVNASGSFDRTLFLIKVQRRLVEFILEMSGFRHQNTAKTHLNAFFLFNTKLTQEKFHILTDISRGTISEHLAEMVDKGDLQLEYNPQSNMNEYSLNRTTSEMSNAFTMGVQRLESEINFFSDKIQALVEIQANESPQKSTQDSPQTITFQISSQLIQRLNQLKLTYGNLIRITQWINTCSRHPDQSPKSLELKQTEDALIEHPKPITLNTAMDKIIESLLDHFKNHQIVRYHSEITAEILGLFFIYGQLTQKEIKQLTLFSTGRISQTIKELENFEYIRKVIPRKRPYQYQMPNINKAFLRLYCLSSENMLKWDPKLAEIQEMIESRRTELEADPVFQKISRFLQVTRQFMPINANLLAKIRDFLQSDL